MKTSLFLLALLASCKPAAAPKTSETKDFAYQATAANYAVLFGSVIGSDEDSPSSDLLRYENYLESGYLGRFDVVLKDHKASRAAVLGAFKNIGAKLTDKSSLFVAYTGETRNGKLVVRDGEVGVDDILQELGGKKPVRFLLFTDAVGNETGRYFAKNDAAKAAFPQIIEFLGYSPAVKAGAQASYVGRLSAEFTGETDRAYNAFVNGGANPTLGAFFNSVQEATKKARDVRRADYYVSDKRIADEPLLNGATFPKPQSAVVAAAKVDAQTPVAQNLALAFTRNDGSSGSVANEFKDASYMLVEVSSQWCQPCALAATRLAANAALQAKYQAGGCHQTTLIVSDGDDPDVSSQSCGDAPAKLCAWNGYLTAANPGTAAAAYAHSVLIQETGKQLNAGWLGALKPSQLLHRYPYFFVVDRAGQIVAQPTTGSDGARTSGETESVDFLLKNCQ